MPRTTEDGRPNSTRKRTKRDFQERETKELVEPPEAVTSGSDTGGD